MRPQTRRWIDAALLALVVVWALSLAVDARREVARRTYAGRAVMILTSPLLSVSHALRRGLQRLFLNQFEGERLRRRNAELEQEVTRMRLEVAQTRELNLRLARVAGGVVGRTLAEEYRLLLARVIGRGRSPGAGEILVSRGARDGVEAGQPVVHGDALVGTVREVMPDSAWAQLVIDPNSSVACTERATRVRGVARGVGDPKRIEFMPEFLSDTLKPRADIITSGLTGSLFPDGLLVGQIVGSEVNDFGHPVAVVRPAVDFATLEEVVILTPKPRRDAPTPAPRTEAGGDE